MGRPARGISAVASRGAIMSIIGSIFNTKNLFFNLTKLQGLRLD
jgi:hypothetical protein